MQKSRDLVAHVFNTNRIPDGQTFFTLLGKVSCNKMLDGARYMPKMNGCTDFMEIHISFIETIEKYIIEI